MPGADSIMVVPFTSATQHLSSLPSTFQLGFVADYGGLEMFKVECNSIQSSAKALLLRRGKYDYAFSFTGDSLPVFNVSAFAVDCYQDGYRGTTLINGDLPAFKIPENAQPGQKFGRVEILISRFIVTMHQDGQQTIHQKISMPGSNYPK